MARLYNYILFVCLLLAFAYTSSTETQNQTSNKVYDCRQDWDTGLCRDRYNSPPIIETPEVCKDYCPRGLWETEAGDCVSESECQNQTSNKVYDCRQDWDTGLCRDRYNSPPIIETPEVCKDYCPRGLWETEAGDCVSESECPPTDVAELQ